MGITIASMIPRAVGGQSVPNARQFAGNVAQQVRQELDDLRAAEIVLVQNQRTTLNLRHLHLHRVISTFSPDTSDRKYGIHNMNRLLPDSGSSAGSEAGCRLEGRLQG